MHKGSCLCGAVRYEIDGELGPISYCSWWPKTAPELRRIRVGTLDTPVKGRVAAHIFVASKAEWDDIRDEAPQYDTRP